MTVVAALVAGLPSGSGPRPAAGQSVPPAADSFARPLYVTNSADDGGEPNVARFGIGPDGRISPVDTAVAERGNRGMVFTPDLRYAYVANTVTSSIWSYRVGPDGALTFLDSLVSDTPVGIAMALDGRTVYVSNAFEHTLSVFAVQSDGRLALRSMTPAGAPNPKGVALAPDGRFLYVSHGTPEDAEPDVVTGYAIQPGGALGRQVALAGAGASGHEIVITPDGRFVYVVHTRSSELIGYRVGADGSLTELQRMGAGVWSEGAAVSPDGRLLYVAAVGGPDPGQPTTLLGYTIAADGRLAQVVEIPMPAPIGVAFSPDGRHLYVSSRTEHTITTFAVGRGGGLTMLQTQPSGGLQPGFHSVHVLPNRSPVASFMVSPGGTSAARRFDAGASTDPDGEVARYDWDFGDGTRLPDGGPTPRHTYRRPGTYRVRLTVTDAERCSTQLVYAGQNALCLGGSAATTTRTVTVR